MLYICRQIFRNNKIYGIYLQKIKNHSFDDVSPFHWSVKCLCTV